MGTTLRRATAPTMPHIVSVSGYSLVHVLGAHDVVFAQVGAGLHFDELQRDLPGVLEAMALAHADVDRLVLAERHRLRAARDARRAAHDDPVLRAMVVVLQ